MDWEKAAAAIRGANGLDSGNMYQNYANAGVINASDAQFTGKKEAIQAQNDENARQAAIKAQEIEAKKASIKSDPGQAYMKLGEDGKYRYYNGAGEQMNINQFSLLTGKRPDEILADSENPADQKFVQDYQTMHTFANAWVNGDNDTLKRLRASDPQKYNDLLSKYKTPADMVKAFRNYYSDYYGNTADSQGQQAPRFTGSQLNPKFDFSPDKTDTRGKAVANLLAGSTLDQTLNPSIPQKPQSPNFWETVNPWSGYHNALSQYEEEKKKNPWLAYSSYLNPSGY